MKKIVLTKSVDFLFLQIKPKDFKAFVDHLLSFWVPGRAVIACIFHYFLWYSKLLLKAVHKPILSHIVPFTHKTDSFFILLRGGLRLPLGGLGLPWHGLAGDAGVGLGWPGPGGGLGVAGSGWGWPGTILLSGNYPGTIRDFR